jgi:membrane protease YdiL (CAAX protease family)
VRLELGEPRLASVEHPERALALIVGRTMDAHTALAEAPAWERRLYALTLADTGHEVEEAIGWYEELAAHSLAPEVDLRLAILLGESGRRERVANAVQAWRARGEPLATYAGPVEAAYLGAGRVDRAALADTLAPLGPSWFADAVALRLAAEEPPLAEQARQSMAARAGPLRWRLRALALLDLLLLVLGGLVLRRLWRRFGGWRPAVADAPLPPPWTMGAGLAALVRGGALGALVLLVLLIGHRWVAEQPLLAEALDQPLMYVPMLLVVARSLLAPAGLGFTAAFGLRPRPDGRRACLEGTLVLVAAGIVTDIALGVLSERLGLASHWSEWFDAELAWGAPAGVAVTVLGAVLFAPVFEELIFRGLLYGSLRARFNWPVAAVASALVFGLAHGYGPAGFASVLASGLLWAYLYERTGSLLPGMIAHVVNNAAVAVTLVALLR